MSNVQFLAVILLIALVLLLGTGCTHKVYRGGTPYSDTLCAAGVDAYGNGQIGQVCSGGLR